MDSNTFYTSAEFWVAVAFIIMVSIIFKPAIKSVSATLDARAEKISSKLNDARLLREEAQELLAEHQRKQLDAITDAERFVTNVKIETKRYREGILSNLEASSKLRESQALQRVINAENQAIKEIRDSTVDIAVAAAQKLLAEYLSIEQASMLVNHALQELPYRLPWNSKQS